MGTLARPGALPGSQAFFSGRVRARCAPRARPEVLPVYRRERAGALEGGHGAARRKHAHARGQDTAHDSWTSRQLLEKGWRSNPIVRP